MIFARQIEACKQAISWIRQAHWFKAATETLLIWIISSLVPVLLIWLVGRTNGRAEFTTEGGFWSAWTIFFVPTEVFIYVAAIVAPSVAYMFLHWRARRHSGTYFFLLGVIFLVFLATATVYAISKTNPDFDREFVFYFAMFVYVLALAAWYITQVFQYRLQYLINTPRPESGASISIDD